MRVKDQGKGWASNLEEEGAEDPWTMELIHQSALATEPELVSSILIRI